MKQAPLLKGALEGCVLAIISEQDFYGYQLIQQLHQSDLKSINGGTLYPLLAKLEKNGALTSYIAPSPDGPDRKYFHLTPTGFEQLTDFKKHWFDFSKQITEILRRFTK
ncbi:PadR family transcriptional regulator [Liquorilactobacillus vini]|uniref:PadR family transcriptional regulator n=1 Tax=Liquorilactobacillus vini TaxID=238015 RepID=UPI00031A1BA2|nr:PadR family transcriptional regulator [Liquorilactobacillus vini]